MLDKLDRITTDLGLCLTPKTQKHPRCFLYHSSSYVWYSWVTTCYCPFFYSAKVRDARKSVGYALVFIALLFTTAPAVGAFARVNLTDSLQDTKYVEAPEWFKNWEQIGLVAWQDKNNDGAIQYSAGNAFEGVKINFSDELGVHGERVVSNEQNLSNKNELYIDRDIMVLANLRLPVSLDGYLRWLQLAL